MTATTVRTRQGLVRGEEADGVVCFAGLPYAAAPDPARPRFTPPVAPPAWSGVRAATAFGPVAPQPTAAPGYLPGEAAVQDEECRTLNVWAPAGDHERLPVLVFVHGGAFLTGSGSSVLYRGAHLARRRAVVVTFNYRLGALGFLAHEALGQPGGGCGNWGLADQLAALRYVADNAAAFGGDPANVTVFGESAGAMGVCALLGMPAARGLFRRAIVQSGTAFAHRLPAARGIAEELARLLGTAPTPEGLGAVPLDELLGAQAAIVAGVDEGLGMPFGPVVDGGLLAAHPAEAIAAGSGAVGADVMAGTNRDEFRFFTFLSRAAKGVDADRLEAIVGGYLRTAGLGETLAPGEVVAAYRAAREARGEPADEAALLDAFGTDFVFRIPLLRLLDAHRRHGARTFAYRFDWASPFAGGMLGACHAIELPFVFGSLREPVVGVFSGNGPEALGLSEALQDAWVGFAADGDPSTGVLGAWPTYDEDRRATMVLDTSPAVVERPGEQERAFWEGRLGRYGVGGPIEGAEPRGVAFLDVPGEPPGPAPGSG